MNLITTYQIISWTSFFLPFYGNKNAIYGIKIASYNKRDTGFMVRVRQLFYLKSSGWPISCWHEIRSLISSCHKITMILFDRVLSKLWKKKFVGNQLSKIFFPRPSKNYVLNYVFNVFWILNHYYILCVIFLLYVILFIFTFRPLNIRDRFVLAGQSLCGDKLPDIHHGSLDILVIRLTNASSADKFTLTYSTREGLFYFRCRFKTKRQGQHSYMEKS